jgi:hypothetical protein
MFQSYDHLQVEIYTAEINTTREGLEDIVPDSWKESKHFRLVQR